MSKGSGGAVKGKEGELLDIEQKAMDAVVSQVRNLADASEEMKKVEKDISKVAEREGNGW